jgi:hypothetical protein
MQILAMTVRVVSMLLCWFPQRFLSQNGLCLIIRSHEGPDARHKRATEQKMPSVNSGFSVDHETPSECLQLAPQLRSRQCVQRVCAQVHRGVCVICSAPIISDVACACCGCMQAASW